MDSRTTHVDDPGLGALVEVVECALPLLADPLLDLVDVDAGAVLGKEVLALHLVELGRLPQEVVLEVLLVHVPTVDPQLQESSAH